MADQKMARSTLWESGLWTWHGFYTHGPQQLYLPTQTYIKLSEFQQKRGNSQGPKHS